MALQQVYCQVCGGPILSRNNHNTWLGEAVALTTGYRTQDGVEVDTYYPLNLDVCGFGRDPQQSAKDTDRVVLRFDASYDFDLGPRFQLSRWDKEVELKSLSVCGSLYLPAHDACMRLADRFVDTTSTPDQAAVTSIIKLWDVLCRRVDQVFGYTMTAGPHNFFVEPNSRSYTRWGPSSRQTTSYDTGPEFDLLNSDMKVEICSLNNTFTLGNHVHGELYLAVHENCLQIADRFIQNESVATTSPPGSITSQLTLWEVPYGRVDAYSFTPTYPEEPNKFFADSWTARRCPWDLENPEEDAIYEVITANPLNIPDLTETILSNLRPVKQSLNSESQSDTHRQELWCDALAQTDRLPWLWDLNVESIRSKQRAGQWDWKELVTKLRQSDIHQPVDVSLQLPLSLRNRRRIWRILEVARVNDVADIASKARMTGPTAWMYGGVTNPPSAHPLYGYEILPLPEQPLPPHSASGFPPPSGSLLRPQSATNHPPTSYYQEAMKNRPPGFMGPPPSHAEYLKNHPLGFPKPPPFHRKITNLLDLVSSGLPVSSSITSEAKLEPSESSTRGTNGPLLIVTEQQFPSQEKSE